MLKFEFRSYFSIRQSQQISFEQSKSQEISAAVIYFTFLKKEVL